ncbi:MAG: Csa1 family protein [Sarcina sp.]
MISIQCIGCGENNYIKSDAEVLERFTTFLDIFPNEDLSFLYEGERGIGGNGIWRVESSIYEKGNEIKAELYFDSEKREAKGELKIRTDEVDEEGYNITGQYPVYYSEGRIQLIDEKVPESVKRECENFKFINEFVELNSVYLKSLLKNNITYHGLQRHNKATYSLPKGDKLIEKIKELYPQLLIDEKECLLVLNGKGEDYYEKTELELVLGSENRTRMEFLIESEGTILEKDELSPEELGLKEDVILNKIGDFFEIFQQKNLSFLYDKEGGKSITENKEDSLFKLDDGDRGAWVITSKVFFDSLHIGEKQNIRIKTKLIEILEKKKVI